MRFSGGLRQNVDSVHNNSCRAYNIIFPHAVRVYIYIYIIHVHVYVFSQRAGVGIRGAKEEKPARGRQGCSLLCGPFSWRPVRMSVWRQTPPPPATPSATVIFSQRLYVRNRFDCAFRRFEKYTTVLVVFSVFPRIFTSSVVTYYIACSTQSESPPSVAV